LVGISAGCGVIKRHVQYLRALWDGLRASFWLLPAVMSILGAMLTGLVTWLDGALDPREDLSWLVFIGEPGGASSRLGTLLASMITMATLIFSITMVVLTLAANQFGPRLVRNFMASLKSQVVIGTSAMTIVFCLLSYGVVGSQPNGQQIATATVTFAIGLTLLSLALVVMHIHALAKSIVAETIIEWVGQELDRGIAELPVLGSTLDDDPEAELPRDYLSRADLFGPSRSGYIQALEIDSVVEAARRGDVLVGLEFQAGDFVVRDGRGIGVYPVERSSPELRDEIVRAISVGTHRTPVQDLEFSIRHLVEIAVRALSPGINDPYTAVSVTNRLSASLALLMGRDLPAGVFRDGDGRTRLICPRPTYAGVFASALSQIRQNGGDKPIMLITLLDAVARMAPHVRTEAQRAALAAELKRICDAMRRRIDDPNDLKDVEDRARAAEHALRVRSG
jgi:uncharacterized membrane protein